MSQVDILSKLDTAYKAITTSDITTGLLKPQKAERFIRVVEDSTPLLSAARRITMTAPTREIDRIQFGGRILAATGETDSVTSEQKVNIPMNKLDAQELTGFVGLTDRTLEDNIEKGNFENTLIDLLGGQIGLDLEHLYLSGDKSESDSLLKVTDGWLIKAANKVTGADAPEAGKFDKTKIE
ncbi:phage major capsid protein [Polycladospora coralii]|uniref:phage major capsid protein n=1 Tax=Polycladospora coralii TaxID=2771432 RepID=UPI001CD0F29F|nr:phage major capsid protein [Polycladospora coralii]